jgi:hypothetical protein
MEFNTYDIFNFSTLNNILEGQQIHIKQTPTIDMEEFVKHKECSKKNIL